MCAVILTINCLTFNKFTTHISNTQLLCWEIPFLYWCLTGIVCISTIWWLVNDFCYTKVTRPRSKCKVNCVCNILNNRINFWNTSIASQRGEIPNCGWAAICTIDMRCPSVACSLSCWEARLQLSWHVNRCWPVSCSVFCRFWRSIIPSRWWPKIFQKLVLWIPVGPSGVRTPWWD